MAMASLAVENLAAGLHGSKMAAEWQGGKKPDRG
jgi:hypothetical protein